MRVTVHGRGAHGSMPQAAIDPVVLAAMIVVRLQTVVAREIAPGDVAVLTVGSIQAGTKSNVIPDHAVLQLNVRTYDERTRTTVLDAIERIVRAECDASGATAAAGFRAVRPLPADRQRPGRHRTCRRPRSTTSSATGPASCRNRVPARTSAISRASSARRTRTGASAASTPRPTTPPRRPGGLDQDIPVNHSATFAPVLQPTLDTGTQALVAAALAWLQVS